MFYTVDLVGVYFTKFVIYYILCKEKYMEEINTELRAN